MFRTTGTSGNVWRNRRVRGLAAIAVAVAALASSAVANAAYVASSSGSPGYAFDLGLESCFAPLVFDASGGTMGGSRYIRNANFSISRSPLYPSSDQTIYVRNQLQWFDFRTSGWTDWTASDHQLTLKPSQLSSSNVFDRNLNNPDFSANFWVDPYGGYYYRIRVTVWWYAGAIQLGKETLAYDSGSSSGSAAQVIQLTNTTEVACWIP